MLKISIYTIRGDIFGINSTIVRFYGFEFGVENNCLLHLSLDSLIHSFRMFVRKSLFSILAKFIAIFQSISIEKNVSRPKKYNLKTDSLI